MAGDKKKVIIIGAGAAGLMAGVMAAREGADVTILEKNEKAGKKIYITGKGRCNFTNMCAPEDFFSHVRRNSRFMYSSFYAMTNEDVAAFFQNAGMKVKIERGNRAFPESDHASDVTGSLVRLLNRYGAKIRFGVKVKHILTGKNGDGKGETAKGVILDDGTQIFSDAVIVCTGGLSYPSTGSTGDGYALARETGHTVTACLPSLVPLRVREEKMCVQMQGLSLKNVRLRMTRGKKTLYDELGEMLFTHFGVSGPLVLTASTLLPVSKAGTEFDLSDICLHIDLKPALSEKQLDERILREIAAAENKQVKTILHKLFPSKMIPVMIGLCGIDPETKCNCLTREQRTVLACMTKDLVLHVTGTGGFVEAIITRGGVDVKQIRPDTMESKLVSGLFFAGEVLDLDAVTGGFNLQIAWSCGAAAGRGAGSQKCKELRVESGDGI